MAKVDFKLNLKGLNELMKSAEMQNILNDAANQMADICGEGYEVEAAHPISFVAIAQVRAGDFKARLDNSKNNTLAKAKRSVKV